MEGAYLPGNIRQRMQELMKEHKITQAQLATRIGSTESAISRFVSGKTDKISTEHLLRIAKVFEVSTDFLLGEVNTPDRTNFDIEELGLSVQAARNLYTGKANAEIVNRLLESPRFADRRRGICTPEKPIQRSSTAFWKARTLQRSPT